MKRSARQRQIRKLSKSFPIGSLIKYPEYKFMVSNCTSFKIGIVLDYVDYPTATSADVGLLVTDASTDRDCFIIYPTRCVLLSKPVPSAWKNDG